MPNIPGYLMSDESYILTAEQVDALNSMPPGLYFVCSNCRKFRPLPIKVTFTNMFNGEMGMTCEECT